MAFCVKRWKLLREFVVFTVFLALFITFQFEAFPVGYVYQQNAAVADLLLDEEFAHANHKKNYDDIMTYGEWWEWAQGPLLEGLFPDRDYNGRPLDPLQFGYVVNGDMRLVGGVQVRQARVGAASCDADRYEGFDKDDDGHVPCRDDGTPV